MMKTVATGTRRLGAWRGATALMLLTLASACGDKDAKSKPGGQVVATVAGEEVTVHELNAELAATRLPASIPRKQAEAIALQRVIERKMLVQAAQERKIDQNPTFLLQQRRANEGMLVQALQGDIARKVPEVRGQEVTNYIEANPNLFRERKYYILDQIVFLRPDNIAQLPLEPAKTMADVEKVLTDNNVDYRRQPASLDALTTNPTFIDGIVKMVARDPNEVFMYADQPQGAPAPVVYVNQIKQTRVIPYTGDRARQFAQRVLQTRAVQESLGKEAKGLQAKMKEVVAYQEGYGPPPTPKELAQMSAKQAATTKAPAAQAATTQNTRPAF